MELYGVSLQTLNALDHPSLREREYNTPDSLIKHFETVDALIKEGYKEAIADDRELQEGDP